MSKQEIDQLFKKAAEDVKKLNYTPSNEELLKLYAYYKQATVGDINIDKPYFYQVKETAKWNAWNDVKGVSKLQAKVSYIRIVKELM
jgi:diazepam-binding inhibitor (GABA receptor modulating acyl-CoA-binding protein)